MNDLLYLLRNLNLNIQGFKFPGDPGRKLKHK